MSCYILSSGNISYTEFGMTGRYLRGRVQSKYQRETLTANEEPNKSTINYM